MDKNEQRICWYSTLLIVCVINLPKLLALREDGIAARFWHFNLGELIFQVVLNLFFCWLLFYINLTPSMPLSAYRRRGKYHWYVLFNICMLLFYAFFSGSVQRWLFEDKQLVKIFWLAYYVRFGLSGLLTGILVKIMLLLRDGKKKDIAHEKLKSAHMAAELELLKTQMNPHFLFNSLSSLSGVIRENPQLAQRYVRELSNVLRYALVSSETNLVTVEQELTMLQSFAQLIKMRMENAFQLNVLVDGLYLPYKIPHLSLQPLLENAVKHNAATVLSPLVVTVSVQHEGLVVCNNLWAVLPPDNSSGLGLANLNERYKIMLDKEIEIIRTDKVFTVKLPLKP